MRLVELLEVLEDRTVRGDATAVDVSAVDYDSRRVREGSLFCCVVGRMADGHDFAPEAVRSGAAALVCERPLGVAPVEVVVPDVRAAMGPLSGRLIGDPSQHMAVIGITGTNGKTTTAHLVQSVLAFAGRPCGLIGTLTGARTTPEAPDLQQELASLLDRGCEAVAMEVSSHALALHRVDGTRVRVAVLTNLGREHLDFHADLDDYFAAKARLFTPSFSDTAVVNGDDPYGRRLLDRLAIPAVPYSVDAAGDLDIGLERCSFAWRGQQIDLGMGGSFNVSNALAAAEAARVLGVPDPMIAEGLSAAGPVPGRYERIDVGQEFAVIVDYAHTPEGLEQVLSAARAATSRGRVLVVFGCGGDRDPSKRPQMGAIAAALADVAVLTSDNPRNEDPHAIIDGVLSGVPRASDLVVEPDRRSAILLALTEAEPGDVVLITGKGHEDTQIIGEQVFPFDDRVVARELLAERRGLGA